MPHSTPHLWHELAFKDQGLTVVAGLDEAGRGAWAGSVVAGAVVLPLDKPDLLARLDGVRDSKECTPRQRDALYDRLHQSVQAAVGLSSAEEIDEIGIAPATRLAMERAIENLAIRPQALLIDYLRLPQVALPQRHLVRGEHQSLSIAAASIIAKVTRDRLMIELDRQYPAYGFARHKGYGTSQHRAALAEHGPCPIHRRSFAPLRLALAHPELADEARPGA